VSELGILLNAANIANAHNFQSPNASRNLEKTVGVKATDHYLGIGKATHCSFFQV
jgi:hypothetical protein